MEWQQIDSKFSNITLENKKNKQTAKKCTEKTKEKEKCILETIFYSLKVNLK